MWGKGECVCFYKPSYIKQRGCLGGAGAQLQHAFVGWKKRRGEGSRQDEQQNAEVTARVKGHSRWSEDALGTRQRQPSGNLDGVRPRPLAKRASLRLAQGGLGVPVEDLRGPESVEIIKR